jgi:hypothetical protein
MYYKREPRPRVSVIGARLEELAARRKAVRVGEKPLTGN